MTITVELVPYSGWTRNVRLANESTEVLVTLDVGPRILRFGPHGHNLLGEVTAQLGSTNETEWRVRGGHRLWTAPEDPVRTYALDNVTVSWQRHENGVVVTSAADATTRLERSMRLEMSSHEPGLTVNHTVTNRGDAPQYLAPWGITVMPPGGTALIPLPPVQPRRPVGQQTSADYAPRMTLSLWPWYTFDDPRFVWGKQLLRVRHDPQRGSTKVGFALTDSWAAYWRDGHVFAKSVARGPGIYPDGGCNFEVYADEALLELETLGPLTSLAPGQSTHHTEHWWWDENVPAPAANDAVVLETFAPTIDNVRQRLTKERSPQGDRRP